MGRQYIDGFLEQGVSIDGALKIQLQCNHYPPVHLDFIPACKEAIEACQPWNEEYDRVIKLPNGKELSASAVVEGLHLDSFLEMDS